MAVAEARVRPADSLLRRVRRTIGHWVLPLYALFDGLGFGASFAASFRAFTRHFAAFMGYGAIAFALIALGLLTMGLGLVIALPLIACATYAAWRDVGAVTPSGAGGNP